jgi:branched-chain amino acid transport system substrate-binding protein
MRRSILFLAMLLAGPALAQDRTPIRIGSMFETSGNIASLGNQGYEGAQIVLEQINKAGGINGRPVELVQINTESDETKSVTAVKRLLEREKVTALIGPHNSGSNFAIIDIVQRAKMPMVTNGTSMQIGLPAGEKPWIFMAQVTDATVISTVIEQMKKSGIKKIALLNADSAFAVSGREQWEILAPKAGLQLVMQETFGNSDQDMTPQLTKIRGSDADAVIIWAAGPGQAIAVKNYRQLGIDKPLFTSHGCVDPNLLRLAGEALNGIVCASSKIAVAQYLPDSDPQKADLLRFIADFQAKYGRAPSMFAGNGADSLRMLAVAISKAGTQAQKIRGELEGLKNFVGLNYMFSYSPQNHFGVEASSLVLMTVRDLKFYPIDYKP